MELDGEACLVVKVKVFYFGEDWSVEVKKMKNLGFGKGRH